MNSMVVALSIRGVLSAMFGASNCSGENGLPAKMASSSVFHPDKQGLPAMPVSQSAASRTRTVTTKARCVTRVIRDPVPGDLIDIGVWRGGATIYNLHARSRSLKSSIVSCGLRNSFEGLPVPDSIRSIWAMTSIRSNPSARRFCRRTLFVRLHMVMMERNLMRVMIILYAAVLLGGAGTMWMSAPPAAQPVCCTFAR